MHCIVDFLNFKIKEIEVFYMDKYPIDLKKVDDAIECDENYKVLNEGIKYWEATMYYN